MRSGKEHIFVPAKADKFHGNKEDLMILHALDGRN